VKICSDPSGIIEVTSQDALEELSQCEVIEGQLWIRGANIDDLGPVSALRLVTDELAFSEVAQLESLEGLAKLEHVGSLYIAFSDAITDLQGLDGLRSIGGGLQNNRLVFEDNASLVSISELAEVSMTVDTVEINSQVLANFDGLPQFTSLRSVWIATPATELSMFSELERCDSIRITYNPSLTTINLDALAEGALEVLDNPALTSIGLDALETGSLTFGGSPLVERVELPNLRTAANLVFQSNAGLQEIAFQNLRTVSDQFIVGGNEKLTSLGNLDALESVGQLEISWNPALPQCLVDELDARLGACGPRTCEGNNASATCE